MGNHEFCLDCGENDFHSHRDCDPVVKAKYQESIRPKPAPRSVVITLTDDGSAEGMSVDVSFNPGDAAADVSSPSHRAGVRLSRIITTGWDHLTAPLADPSKPTPLEGIIKIPTAGQLNVILSDHAHRR